MKTFIIFALFGLMYYSLYVQATKIEVLAYRIEKLNKAEEGATT